MTKGDPRVHFALSTETRREVQEEEEEEVMRTGGGHEAVEICWEE